MTDSHTIQQPRRRRFFCGALLVLLLLSSPLNAQDIHFSQIDINPILYDPAYSGFFDGIGRFGLTYRNQWSSVSKAFQTVAATAELSLLRRKRNGDGLNLGCILFSDRAGTLHYGTTAGNIILSYYKSLNSSNNSFLSGAIELGAGQAGFNTGDIVMEDPSDNMPSTAANFVTLGAGLAWFVQPNDDCFVKLGVSGRNLNQPHRTTLQRLRPCRIPCMAQRSAAAHRSGILPETIPRNHRGLRRQMVPLRILLPISDSGGRHALPLA